MLEVGSDTKFQLLSLFNIIGPFLGLTKNLGACHQGSYPGASPLTGSLARKALDWVLGSMIPRLPFDRGRVREFHVTLPMRWLPCPPNEVANYRADLATHIWIGAPTCGHVPHGGE
jgi:hypothetical protein